jgi:CRISPR/Cas system-associated protein endoribonuclease Cas2
MTRFELVTSSLPRKRSTPELHRRKKKRARDRVRTGDIQLGRLTLYQLSYSRIVLVITSVGNEIVNINNLQNLNCGESRIRTCEVKKQQIYSLSSLAA